jgi:hypothetical protein
MDSSFGDHALVFVTLMAESEMSSSVDIIPGLIDQLSQVISHVVAPAFLLGAVASFISILIGRMDNVIGRLRYLNDLPDTGHLKSALKADVPRLRRRAYLLQQALYLSISSGAAAAVLIIVAFGAALLNLSHVLGAALLFVISMALLCASLIVFAREVMIGLNEFDEF